MTTPGAMLVPSSASAMNEFSKRASTVPDPTLISENRVCPGCRNSVVNESGGVVVAFGQSFFHVDCFKCAKCGDQVTADTNLLLLSDGSPICANCSYSCNVCKLPILDEAIMTGDDSYHAHCFKCKVCSNRIDELVFAKTSQGIYCMNCHNQRVARSRRHQQRKKEQAAAAANPNGTGSSRSRGQPSPGADSSEPGRRRPSREPATPSRSTPDSTVGNPQQNGAYSTPTSKQAARSPSRSQPSLERSMSTDNSPYAHPDIRPTGSRPMSSSSRHRAQNSGDSQPQMTSPDSDGVPPMPGPRMQARSSSDSGPPMGSFHTSPRGPSDAPPIPEEFMRRRSNEKSSRPSTAPNQSAGSTIFNGAGLQAPASRSESRNSANPMPSFDALMYSESSRRVSTLSNSSNGRSSNLNHSNLEPAQRSDESRHPYASAYFSEESMTTSPAADQLSSSSSPGPSNQRLDPGLQQRTRAASSSTQTESSRRNDVLRPPLRPSVTADRVPYANGHEPSSARSGDITRSMAGRLSPLAQSNGNSAQSIRTRRSFDERPQPPQSPAYSLSGRLSPGSEQHANWAMSNSTSPPSSPSHRVDVPVGIESESDRESGEGDGLPGQKFNQELGPTPPPKEAKGAQKGFRPPRLHLEASQSDSVVADTSNAVTVENEEPSGSELSRESSPVESTSHSTFIAPALPPIRFSMAGADFSDFMKFGETHRSSTKTLEKIGERDEPSSKYVSPAQSQTTLGSTMSSTPTSEITIIGNTDDTPKRNGSSPAQTNGHSTASSVTSLTAADDTPRPPSAPSMAENVSSYSFQQRSSSDSQRQAQPRRERMDSNASVQQRPSLSTRPINGRTRMDTSDLVAKRLQESLDNAMERSMSHMKFDREFVEAIVTLLVQRKEEFGDMKAKLDGMKRTSQQYMDGLTVAHTEYEKEIKARRDAESEVTRLRVLLSGQAMKLTALSGETKRQEAQVQLTREMSDKMTGLERDLSNLRVERDMTLVEVEELSASASKSSGPDPTPDAGGANLSRNITTKLDKIKKQYKRELLPLTQQRERLEREIEDLKSHRDLVLEETTVLNARNEELAQLTAQYVRRAEAAEAMLPSAPTPPAKQDQSLREKPSQSFDRARLQQSSQSLASHSSTTLNDDAGDVKIIRAQKQDGLDVPGPFRPPKFLKWSGKASREHLNNKEPAINVVPPESNRPKPRAKEHTFQQLSALRIGKCDHCGEKMWGSHLRCSSCSITIHPRCLHHIQIPCSQHTSAGRDESTSHMGPMPPSMFGRDLSDQVRSDSKGENRTVPVIVEKCIDAVDALALDYEGIYRKTGGSGQSKIITQLFERGEYAAFDLHDQDRFNDISSVTSVLKTYFRSLPDPLFTYALHDNFIAASMVRDPAMKSSVLTELVGNLPREHYYTARTLMLHLNRVAQQSDTNLMTPRNLGVVFGPTLMRSQDPSAEFSDMAGKALTVEWLVENAPTIFQLPDA